MCSVAQKPGASVPWNWTRSVFRIWGQSVSFAACANPHISKETRNKTSTKSYQFKLVGGGSADACPVLGAPLYRIRVAHMSPARDVLFLSTTLSPTVNPKSLYHKKEKE